MFEFSVLRKYLIPRKRHLSVSLIGLMSLLVISLVVWLILVFLSVTTGIEKNWLNKLTQLNAPIQIAPSEKYYNSYYYLIDNYSLDSSYSNKTIREKLLSPFTDPYNPDIDSSLPAYFPHKESKDLVKTLFQAIDKISKKHPDIKAQDYEVAPGLIKIKMIRPLNFQTNLFAENFITQACYVASIAESNPHFSNLLIPPSLEDLNHILNSLHYQSTNITADAESDLKGSMQSNRLKRFFHFAHVKTVAIKENYNFIPQQLEKDLALPGQIIDGVLFVDDSNHNLVSTKNPNIHQIVFPKKIHWKLYSYQDNGLATIETKIHTQTLSLQIPISAMQITSANPCVHLKNNSLQPLWAYTENGVIKLPYNQEEPCGILLPKNFKDSHVKIRDIGYISYGSFSFSKNVEQRKPIQVLGFYDPGLMSLAGKSILAPYEFVHDMHLSSNAESSDVLKTNAVQIWHTNLSQSKQIAQDLKNQLQEEGLTSYFTVQTYSDYPFSKDLMQQFQSDKYLFMLIGFIILLVACSNIIALLLMLIKDKKQEIGIMQAMGASKTSIGLIFGGLGAILGLISCLAGIGLAYLTLINIDSIAYLLSMLQGREAFNPLFYGNHLPNQISMDALIFLLCLTPTLSLVASLIPAWFAMRLSPSEILKSQG